MGTSVGAVPVRGICAPVAPLQGARGLLGVCGGAGVRFVPLPAGKMRLVGVSLPPNLHVVVVVE